MARERGVVALIVRGIEGLLTLSTTILNKNTKFALETIIILVRADILAQMKWSIRRGQKTYKSSDPGV